MSRTTTIPVDLQRLKACEKNGVTIIQIMLAVNDISLANHHLQSVDEKEYSLAQKHIQKGALRYFFQIQCSHLHEIMNIIKKIKGDPDLLEIAGRCTRKAQDSFNKLTNCLKGGPGYNDFKKYVEGIRNKITFHYDTNMVRNALSDRAGRPEASRAMITIGGIGYGRFELTDDILDSIVCRHIWKIPRKADLLQEADRITAYISDLCKSFVDFAGEFATRYIQENAQAR